MSGPDPSIQEVGQWSTLGEDSNGEVFYRRMNMYTAKGEQTALWRTESGGPANVSLDGSLVAAAPYGGPVALVRDPKKVVRAAELKPTVRVFTSAGGFISKWEWPKGRRGDDGHDGDHHGKLGYDDAMLRAIGWTLDEHLLTIGDDGMVTVYDMHGDVKREFSITLQCDVAGYEVRMATIFPGGFTCLVSSPCCQDGGDDEPRKVDDAKLLGYLRDSGNGEEKFMQLCDLDELTVEPFAVECAAPELTEQGELEVFVTPRDIDHDEGTIWECREEGMTDLQTQLGHIAKIAISPNGRFVATFNTTGKVAVALIDLRDSLSEFGTKSEEPPHQLVWCGNDCIVCCWLPHQIKTTGAENTKSLVLIIGPKDDHEKFTYVGPVHLVSECDSVRVVSDGCCDIIQKVPKQTVEIFEMTSLHEAVTLWDAYVDYEEERASNVKSIRRLNNTQLEKAVDHCIDAAGHEFHKDLQARLLRAAAYGKCFCKGYDADKFVDRCKNLRVLNAVREPDVGIPLTWEQYMNVSADVLIERLVARNLYMLAYRTSHYLGHKTEKVLIAWACAKVRTAARDDAIAQDVEDKFRQCPGISYAEVAQQAFVHKRKGLAIMLLEKEPKASDQVPLLLNFDEDDKALEKAIDSGDTDLVHLVVLHMKRKFPEDKFMQTLSHPPNEPARDLFVTYCEHRDKGFLQEYYRKTKMYNGTAFLALRAFFDDRRAPDMNAKIKCLDAARTKFKEVRDRAVEAKAMEDHMKLMEKQERLARDKRDPEFNGASLAQTLRLLFKHHMTADAEKMKKEFAVSERMFAWIRLRALCEFEHWEELSQWGLKGKPVIGYKPFVSECTKYKDRGKIEAGKYVSKIADYAERCEMYCGLGMIKEAIDIADKEKEPGLLQAIRSEADKVRDRDLIIRIDRLLQQY